MATYSIHAGHGPAGAAGCGVLGWLDESVENRKVVPLLCDMIKNSGNIVFNDTVDIPGTPQRILNRIITNINTHGDVDLIISIHLNAGRKDLIGDGKTGGVEVWGYDTGTKNIGEKICQKISNKLNITNRGYKINPEFYILKHTKYPAIIVECCFTDDYDDFLAWDPEKAAEAIAEALTGENGNFLSKNELVNFIAAPDYNGNSFVDALKSIHIDSTFANRAEIAHANGILEYNGTAKQNTTLLNKLKAGNLKIYNG